MKKESKIFSLMLLFTVCCGCTHIPEKNMDTIDTKIAETVSVAVTETFAALPSATATNTETPTPTETIAPTKMQLIEPLINPQNQATTTPETTFADRAKFVEVSPSVNGFTSGQVFQITWKIQNIGTTSWSGKYRFYHKSGIQLANAPSYSISDVISPGGTLIVPLLATAPTQPGTYQSTWALANPEGIEFYFVYFNVTVGDTTYITALPTETATATP